MAWSPLVPSTSPSLFNNCRVAHVSLFSLWEKTQFLISPYTCYGLRALCYGWSAAVLWSHLFFLHVYGLRARCYGLWVSQGREFNIEYIARTPLMLPLSPSSYNNCRPEHVLCCFLWKRLNHRFSLNVPRALCSMSWVVGCGSWVTSVTPTHAWAPRSTLWTLGWPRP